MLHQAPPAPAGYVCLRTFTGEGAFGGGESRAVQLSASGSEVTLDSTSLLEGTDRQVYSRGQYFYGELTSGVYAAPQPFDTVVPSWNASTPDGTWVEVQVRACTAGNERWTEYYSFGYWAERPSTIGRRSIADRSDADGTVATDTLRLSAGAVYSAFQYRLRLYTTSKRLTPTVRLISVLSSDSSRHRDGLSLPPFIDVWGMELPVPERSQMVYGPHGKVWCSPTSTSMVMAYWGRPVSVLEVAEGVYDLAYRGTGNWPFNTAWAGAFGLEAYVARFCSMAQVEAWIGAGVPVILSLGFGDGALDGAPIAWTDGHILVVRGFDERGDVIVNEPAAPSDAEVRRVYRRDQLEQVWLRHSGGIVYLIYPTGHPAPVRGSFGCW